MSTETHKYTKRIMGLFGHQLPPRKVKKYQGYLPMHFILTGNLPSKKNNWTAASNFLRIIGTAAKKETVAEAIQFLKDRMKHYMRPSNDFKEWETKAKEIIAAQAGHYSVKYRKYGILFPVKSASISLYCYYANNKAKDNANRLESIQDVLTDVGVITSDAWQNLNRIHVEAENYHGEIKENMFVITLTINLEKSLEELAYEVKMNDELL